jgi:hypothetical protein
MQVDVRNLSLMIFPQQWSGMEFIVNLLLVPNGDPTVGIGGEQPFAQAQPVLRAAFLPGFAKPSWDPTISPASIIHSPLYHVVPPSPTEIEGLLQPPLKSEIFQGLSQQFTPVVLGRAASEGSVKKDLPLSYQEAAGFGSQDPSLFAAGDGYGCDLRGARPKRTPVPKRALQWGEIFSHALRQPLIAQAIGMSYVGIHIPIDPAQVAGGGWLWIEIDTASPSNWYSKLVTSSAALPYYEQPVRLYSARIPALTSPQSLFAAVLFPTIPTVPKAASNVLHVAQYEADTYVDGFAKIVHGYQPDTADAIVGNDPNLVPGTDAGFHVGWDDVQVTTWFQRQVQAAQDLHKNNPADEFPLGVQSYRVDARHVSGGTADPQSPTPPWESLVKVNATVSAGDSFTASQDEELGIEPTPVANGDSTNFWLPRYFAHWRGRSLVVNDPYAYAFSGGQAPPAYPQNPGAPQFSGTLTEDINIGLRYGEWYQFRARLSDLTGGGPAPADTAPDAGVATLQFLRYVPPKAVTASLDQKGNPSTITVTRPRLNYPEMVFAGAAAQADLDNFLSQLQAGTITSVSTPDPDVVTLEIIVEARAPVGDTGNHASMRDMSSPPRTGDLDDSFRVIYTQRVPFAGDTVTLTFDPAPFNQIRLIPPPAAGSTTLAVPTGRNLRIRLRGLGNASPEYWGSPVASTGLVTDVLARYEAPLETGVIVDANVSESLPAQLQAFYLREDPAVPQQNVVAAGVNSALAAASFSSDVAKGLRQSLALAFKSSAPTPIQNLAQALNLPVTGQSITAPPGRRILFGAQNTLRHSITQDGSSITFSSLKDLIGHWIVVIRLTLDRDWTYSGIAQNGANQTGFAFSGGFSMTGPPVLAEVGRIALPGVVADLAAEPPADPSQAVAQRDQTDLIFFATVDTTVPPNLFPDVTQTAWQLTATFTGAPTSSVTLWSSGAALELPITLPPRQTPRLVSAGIAESSFIADANYASTEQRQRALWFEFDAPPADKHDAYFYRVLSYGPDPLLVSAPHDLLPQTEPPLPVDPEWIRIVSAGDTNDDAGVGAMTELVGATAPLNSSKQPVHYIVPLPDSVTTTDLKLFGFWTMELRVGHALWSTAQARYGRALRISGVQYPPPPLTVNVDRRDMRPPVPPEEVIVAVADLAQTVYNGVSLTNPLSPQTEIWFLLYAQVARVDGQAFRNILLAKKQGTLYSRVFEPNSPPSPQRTDIPVTGVFQRRQVATLLDKLGLPQNTPTSVLAVELFNGESRVISEGRIVGGDAQPQAQAQEADPLGADLGARRVLRVSPLTPVREVC